MSHLHWHRGLAAEVPADQCPPEPLRAAAYRAALALERKWGQTTFSIVWPKVQPEKRGLSLRCPHKIASHPTVYPDSSAS
jgi:hypothetical protein